MIALHSINEIGTGQDYYIHVWNQLRRGDTYWSKSPEFQYRVLLKIGKWVLGEEL